MKLTFLGATSGVTGSKYLLETEDRKILIDCGLYQGDNQEDLKNWEDFYINPKNIDIVILTHSHIDHIGLLPRLCKKGFKGKIYSTAPTRDFASIFLYDSCHLLQNTAEILKQDLLYNEEDIENCLKQFETVDYHQKISINKKDYFEFFDAGHILGSGFIKLVIDGKKLVFSGDLGNPPVPIIKDTEFLYDADYVIMESTYGNRNHESSTNRIDDLENIIEDTYSKKGTLLIPAFALERTQELMYELNELISTNRIPKIPIYIDSPLAIKATQIYPKYLKYFDDETKKIMTEKNLFNFPEVSFIEDVELSKKLDSDKQSKIIIAGSGMSTGGRILYHEQAFLSDPTTTILIIGFQVRGSLGRKIQDGYKDISINGVKVTINADVKSLLSYSAHADQAKLIYWLDKMNDNKNIKNVFLTHGEIEAKNELRTKIQDTIGLKTNIPKDNEEVLL